MTNEEKYLNERVGHKNPFRVPEGYFEHFTSQMMEQLPERKPKSKLVALRPWLYAAACSVAVVIMGFTYQMLPLSSSQEDMHQMAVSLDNAYMEEAADYAMIDNMEIYACLSDNEK